MRQGGPGFLWGGTEGRELRVSRGGPCRMGAERRGTAAARTSAAGFVRVRGSGGAARTPEQFA